MQFAERKLSDVLRVVINGFSDPRMAGLMGRCESPIEVAFLEATIASAVSPPEGSKLCLFLHETHFPNPSKQRPPELIAGQVEVWVQPKIGPYRPDFLWVGYRGQGERVPMIVECDGEKYHRRTADQVLHDRRRDADFKANGYKVVRFSGSEIHNNSKECVKKARAVLLRAMWPGEYEA